MGDLDLERALDVARRAVARAGEVSLRHFRAGVAPELKPDRSPVTVADKESEAAILAIVREVFPDHSILAEESGAIAGAPDARWIVDPLDGTRGFCRGAPFWGPLVALEHRGEIVVGAAALPVLGRTYWAARGLGAWRDGSRLAVSRIAEWGDATLSLGQLPGLLPRALQLVRTANSARCWGDVAGCAMLLDGQADAWLEAGVRPWDLAALKVLVEEAGGRFTDFAGGPSFESEAVASNGLLHGHVLGGLSGSPAAT